MSYALGIDVGSSFTAAAVTESAQGGRVSTRIVRLGSSREVVPSTVHVDADGGVRIGDSAERRALDEPGSVVRDVKSRVGDPIPLVVGDIQVAAPDAFAMIVRWVVDLVEEREGSAPGSVVVTHPAGWGRYRLDLVESALAGVGLAGSVLVAEPVAAAAHYSSRDRLPDGAVVLVYDLGGGTFDTCLMRQHAGGVDILTDPDGLEDLGGSDFDAAVRSHVLGFTRTSGGGASEIVAARLHRECVEAKECLSFDTEAVVPLLTGSEETSVRLVRDEFEGMISDDVDRTVDLSAAMLERAGLEPADLHSLLLTGGSSRIPLVAQRLSARFGRPLALDVDPKAVVCLGAARLGAEHLPAIAPPAPAPAETETTSATPDVLHPPITSAHDHHEVLGLTPVAGLRRGAFALGVAAVIVGAGAFGPAAIQAAQDRVGVDLLAGDTGYWTLSPTALEALTAAGVIPAPAEGGSGSSDDGQEAGTDDSEAGPSGGSADRRSSAAPQSDTPTPAQTSAPGPTAPAVTPASADQGTPAAANEQPADGSTEPAPDPTPSDPVPSDPAPVDPVPEPEPSDPAPVDPEPVDPAPVDPPADPAPTDPAPADPAPVDAVADPASTVQPAQDVPNETPVDPAV